MDQPIERLKVSAEVAGRRGLNFGWTLVHLSLFVVILIGAWALFSPAAVPTGPESVLPAFGESVFIQNGYGNILLIAGAAFVLWQSL